MIYPSPNSSAKADHAINAYNTALASVASAFEIEPIRIGAKTLSPTYLEIVKPVKSGFNIVGVNGKLYNRIHIEPKIIDFGNLLSNQSVTVEVWNAFDTVSNLSGYTVDGDQIGLSLVGLPVPYSFKPLKSVLVNFTALQIGPPTIDATYYLDFGFVISSFKAVGQRLQLLRFKPTQKHTETLQWFTNIIRTKKRESRIALREKPRQSLAYEYVLTDPEFAELHALLHVWSFRSFGVPLWADSIYIGIVNNSQTTVEFQTSGFDFIEGGLALIYDNNKLVTVEILTLSASFITIKRPTNQNFSDAFIVPVRFGLLDGYAQTSYDENRFISFDAKFDIEESPTDFATLDMPSFNGYKILNRVEFVDSPSNVNVRRPVEVFDNDSGRITQKALTDFNEKSRNVQLAAFNHVELVKIKSFFHYLKGRQKTFLLSTKANELQLVEDVFATSTEFKALSINYHAFYVNKYVEFEFYNGSVVYNKIVGGYRVDDIDVFQVSTPFNAFTVSSVKRVSLMDLVRLNSDSVTFKYESGDICDIRFTVAEVPDVLQ